MLCVKGIFWRCRCYKSNNPSRTYKTENSEEHIVTKYSHIFSMFGKCFKGWGRHFWLQCLSMTSSSHSMEDLQWVYVSQITVPHYIKINTEFRLVLTFTCGWLSTQLGLTPSKRKESCFVLKKVAGRCWIWMQLTVNTQAADGRKNSSYIVPLRRCYICKIISNTALAALVCSHTSEECFLIIQRSLQCCAELTPAEIWSASQRSLMKTAVWHLCVLCKRLLLPLWRWNNDIYFSQRKILAVTRACFHGVLKPWADLSLNLKF